MSQESPAAVVEAVPGTLARLSDVVGLIATTPVKPYHYYIKI